VNEPALTILKEKTNQIDHKSCHGKIVIETDKLHQTMGSIQRIWLCKVSAPHEDEFANIHCDKQRAQIHIKG